MVKLLLVLVATVLAVHITPGSSSSSNWGFYCTGGNFSLGSRYGSNLDALAAVLPRRVSSSPLLFNSSQAVAGSRGEATVYAVAGCQLDTPKPACERCVRGGFEDARRLCGFAHSALVFRDACTVAYHEENLEFHGNLSIHKILTRAEDSDIGIEGREFEEAVGDLARAVAHRAVTSPRYFATGKIPVRTSDYTLELYSLAQCSPNLAAKDCQGCLDQLLDTLFLSGDQTTWRAATVWCLYRYSSHPFYSGPPTVNVPAARTSGGHAGKKHKLAWILGGLGIATVIGIAILTIVLCCRKKKRLLRQKQHLGEKGKQLELKDLEGEEALPRVDSRQVEARPSALDRFQEILKLATSKEIVLFLDYDGTLSPIVSDPDKAYMPGQMRRVLQEASRCFKTSIVSGRARDKVYQFVGLDEINYAGSHGLDIKLSTVTATTSTNSSNNEIAEQHGSYQPAEEHLAAITEVYTSMLRATSMINGATVENNKYCVSVHYRNVAMEDRDTVRQVVENVLNTKGGDLKLTEGKMVFEIRPPTHWNKGDAVLYLLEHLGLGDPTKVFPIYIGDDKTDEDAFKVLLDRGVGILVSEASRETTAVYSLRNPSEVMHFLAMLVKGKQQELARLVCG